MDILNVLAEITIYSGIIFAVTMLLKKCLGSKMSPLLHYAVWMVLVVRLMMPVTIASPVHLFVIPAETQSQIAEEQVQPEAYQPASMPETSISVNDTEKASAVPEVNLQTVQVETQSSTLAAVQEHKPLTLPQIIMFIWLVGAGICLAYLVVLYSTLRRKFKRNAAYPSKRLMAIFEEVKAEMGISTDIKLVCQYEYGTPALMFPRTVLMPIDALVSMNDEQAKFALRHELMHYKRGDHITSILLFLLNAVYWFHPFVWFAFRQIRTDMEIACDGAVVKSLNEAGRTRYASLIVSLFAQPMHRQLILGMAQADARKVAEKRVRGIFMRGKSKKSVKLISALLSSVLLVTCFTTACQPTPETPVVINKNAGVMESAISGQDEQETAVPYSAPEWLEFEVDGLPDDYRIVFDAEVDVSDQTAWPVYTVAPATITQAEAEAVRTALLGDAVLYQPGEFRSREEIQRSIDSYEQELKESEGHPNLITAYQQILKDLYIEYERTPEDLVLEPADTQFAFMENRARPEFYGGTEVILDDGGMRYEWTDEARQRAIAAGCENIYGVCWADSGRKMEFLAGNGPYSTGIYYSVADGNLAQNPGVTCTRDEAIGQADALLTAMGLDFVLVSAQTYQDYDYDEETGESVEAGEMMHTLTYKRCIDGVPQDHIVSCLDQSMDEEYWATQSEDNYRPEIPHAETIMISIDDLGVQSFSWVSPIAVVEIDSDSATLMPFDEVQHRIEQQLRAQTLWDPEDYEKEYIDGRRLEISKVKLSYVLMAKKDDMDSYYLAPVWNVCGDMYYHYADSYDNRDETGGYILDENHERNVWRSRYDTGDYSIITINALDGSVIPRHRGY